MLEVKGCVLINHSTEPLFNPIRPWFLSSHPSSPVSLKFFEPKHIVNIIRESVE